MPPTSENKSEKPTPRRRAKAREEGQVAQSMEVNNVLVLLAGVGALVLFGGHTMRVVLDSVQARLANLHGPELSPGAVEEMARDTLRRVGDAGLPVMCCVAVVGLLCSLAQTGILFTPKKLKPDLKAINPVRGARQLFSLGALQRLVLALAKFALVGTIAWLLLRARLHWMLALVGKSPWGIFSVACKLVLALSVRILAAMVVVALLDYAYQRWRQEKKLMMSKQQVKEEHKREEGDPEVRARRNQIRRSMVHRIVNAVPQADVVVTNPDHLAIALQWDEEQMEAPVVVAKGRNYMAERIKQVARRNGVPVLERRPLARALYSAVEVGMQIPPQLYYAVAEVLAFILKDRAG